MARRDKGRDRGRGGRRWNFPTAEELAYQAAEQARRSTKSYKRQYAHGTNRPYEQPAGVSQPRGRPPKGKVWDRVNAKWIDDEAA